MSKNWKIAVPSAQVYDIPWESKNDTTLEQCRYQTSVLELPKKTNTHLWIINLSVFNHVPFLKSLSNDEKTKLNRLLTPVEREIRAKSRIALRLILAEYLKISPSDIVFSYGENGKPKLETPLNKFSFNISHSANNLAVLIDSHRSIGVDIESELRPSKVSVQLAKRFFSQQEFRMLQEIKSKEKSILFNWIWTLKEAVLKSLGSGIFLIEKTPDFSFVIQKSVNSNLQFYKTEDHVGFTLNTQKFCISTAAKN